MVNPLLPLALAFCVGIRRRAARVTTPVQNPPRATTTTTTTSLEGVRLHEATFARHIFRGFPAQYASLDSIRMTVLLFCLNGLDALTDDDPASTRGISSLSASQLAVVAEWIYRRQLPDGCGFEGYASSGETPTGHIVMTYSALIALLILNDPLKRVNREGILSWLRTLQDPKHGGFRSLSYEDSECDARFVYCACAICFILNDWSGIPRPDLARDYLLSCFDELGGAFGLNPGCEAHGGATYVCVAALKLLGFFDRENDEVAAAVEARVVRFCSSLQSPETGGIAGRVNKDEDTCYGYWLGATLAILGRYEQVINRRELARFLDEVEANSLARGGGGYAKSPGMRPDPLHSFTGAWVRRMTSSRSPQFAPALGISSRALRESVARNNSLYASPSGGGGGGVL